MGSLWTHPNPMERLGIRLQTGYGRSSLPSGWFTAEVYYTLYSGPRVQTLLWCWPRTRCRDFSGDWLMAGGPDGIIATVVAIRLAFVIKLSRRCRWNLLSSESSKPHANDLPTAFVLQVRDGLPPIPFRIW